MLPVMTDCGRDNAPINAYKAVCIFPTGWTFSTNISVARLAAKSRAVRERLAPGSFVGIISDSCSLSRIFAAVTELSMSMVMLVATIIAVARISVVLSKLLLLIRLRNPAKTKPNVMNPKVLVMDKVIFFISLKL